MGYVVGNAHPTIYQSRFTETRMTQKTHDDIRQNVRDSYAQVAEASNEGDGCGVEASCCGVSDDSAINTLISNTMVHRRAA